MNPLDRAAQRETELVAAYGSHREALIKEVGVVEADGLIDAAGEDAKEALRIFLLASEIQAEQSSETQEREP